MADKKVWTATGRRKQSVANVRIMSGKGNITVNGKDVNEYMPYATLVQDIKQPLVATNNDGKFDIEITAKGGGFSGQAGATRLGIVKALLEYDINTDPSSENSFRRILKAKGFITRDSRIKERKKPGLKKARKAPQFSKR